MGRSLFAYFRHRWLELAYDVGDGLGVFEVISYGYLDCESYLCRVLGG